MSDWRNQEPIGLVAFSFALRAPDAEPNPCNKKLANRVEQLIKAQYGRVVVVSQWEITRQLQRDGFSFDLNVTQYTDGRYLDSEGVWDEAKKIFKASSITRVIPVAQPFLQMMKIRKMIEADGFTVVQKPMGWIGFDNSPENTQWWTRGPVRLFVYAVRQILFGSRGHAGKQSA